MNIKISKNEKEVFSIEFPDECKELMKTPDGFHQIMIDVNNFAENDAKNKSNLIKDFMASLTSLGLELLDTYLNKETTKQLELNKED